MVNEINIIKTRKDIMQNDKMFTGYIDAHEYVDLGLSVKWATFNVGATSPSQIGTFFGWGETNSNENTDFVISQKNSNTYGKKMGCITGNPRYDIARVQWGDSWRMPTKEEIAELANRCSHVWTTIDGQAGYMITGPNGNSLFLPIIGMLMGSPSEEGVDFGAYWSATPRNNNIYEACCLYFTKEEFGWKWIERYLTSVVRPVSGAVKLSKENSFEDEVKTEKKSTLGSFFKFIWRLACVCGALYMLGLMVHNFYENGIYIGTILGGVFCLIVAVGCLWLAKK